MADGTFQFEFVSNAPQFVQSTLAELTKLEARLAGIGGKGAGRTTAALGGVDFAGIIERDLKGLERDLQRVRPSQRLDVAARLRGTFATLEGHLDEAVAAGTKGVPAAEAAKIRKAAASLKTAIIRDIEATYAQLVAQVQSTGLKGVRAPVARNVFSNQTLVEAGLAPTHVATKRHQVVRDAQASSAAADAAHAEAAASRDAASADAQAAAATRAGTQAQNDLAKAQRAYARVLEQIAANALPSGRPRDPLGARVGPRGTFFDAQNRPFRRLEELTEEGPRVVPGALVPARQRFIDGLDELTDDLGTRIEAQAAMRSQHQQQERQALADRKALNEQEKIARQRAITNLTQATTNELRAGQATRLPGGFVQRADGEFVRSQRGGSEFRPLRNDAELRLAQEAQAKALAEQERKNAALRESSTRERQYAAALATATEQLRAGTARRLPGGFLQLQDGGFLRSERGGSAFRPLRNEAELLLAQEQAAKANAAAAKRAEADAAKVSAAKAREAQASNRAAAADEREATASFTRLERVVGTLRGGPGGVEGVGRSFRGADFLQSGFSFARYLASAALIGGGIAGIASAKAQIVDYADSVTDLEVAMRKVEGPTRSFLDTLGQTASIAGAKPGEAIDAAARAIRAFGDDTEAVEGRAHAFTATLAEMALITGKTLPDLTGDLIAVQSSFEIDPSNARRFADAVVAARNAFGGNPGQISQGAALFSPVGREAGFELEEMVNIIGLIQARTDQSGQAIATRLSRITSIISGSSGKTFLAELNAVLNPSQQIDLTSSVASQIRQIQQVLPDLNESTRQRLFNRLGGTASMRELIPLLTEGDALNTALADSLGEAGESADEFNRKVSDLRGVLQQISGSIREIIVEVKDSAFLDTIGVALLTLEPALDLISELLKAYNALPHVLRQAIALTLQYIAATKILAAVKKGAAASESVHATTIAATAAASRTTGWTAVGSAAAAGIPGRFGQIRGAAAVGLGAAARGGAAAASGSLALLTNPWTLAVGAAFAGLRQFGSALDRVSDSILTASAEVDKFADVLPSTGSELRDRAGVLEAQAAQLRGSSGGFFGTLASFTNGDQTGRLAAYLEAEGERLLQSSQELDDRIGRVQQTRDRSTRLTVATGSVDAITSSVEALKNTGRGTETILEALTNTLDDLAAAASGAAIELDPVRRQILTQQGSETARAEILGLVGRLFNAQVGEGGFGSTRTGEFTLDGRSLGISEGDLDRTIIPGLLYSSQSFNEAVSELGDRVMAQLGSEQVDLLVQQMFDDVLDMVASGQSFSASGVAEQFVAGLPASATAGMPEAILAELESALTDSILATLTNLGYDVERATTSFAEGLPALVNGLAGGVFSSIFGQGSYARVAGALSRASEGASNLILDAFGFLTAGFGEDTPEQALSVDQVQVVIEQVLSAAQGEAAKIRLRGIIAGDAISASVNAARFIFDELSGLRDRLTSLGVPAEQQEGLDTHLLQAEADLVEAREAASNAASSSAEDALAQAQALRRARTLAGIDPRDAIGEAAALLDLARQELGEFAAGTTEYYEKLREVNEAQIALAQAVADRDLARAGASIDPESELEGAAQALREAQRALELSLDGTAEYWQAVADVRQAQIDYADAQIASASVARSLAGDTTDPVFEANERLRRAREELAADIARGASQDVLDQDLLDVRHAEQAAEQAAFAQRLSDVQTSEQLGRITHQAYLDYLDAERERLLLVQDRTRQQQDQLNQIEQAIQAANDELQGQFNLGEIRTPTPFEVRRALGGRVLNSGYASAVAPSSSVQITNQIQVNGADFGQVVRYLDDALGRSAYSRTGGTASRKF